MTTALGLIAGNRDLPLMVARKVRELKRPLCVVAISGETDQRIEELADHICWITLGELQKPLDFFRSHQITDLMMIGGITQETLLFNYEPDDLAIELLEPLEGNFHTDLLLRSLERKLSAEGFTLRPISELLPELLTEPGCLSKEHPTEALLVDLRLAWEMAKEIGRLDIGQTVVVAEGLTMAVEAAEGTDKTILRGGSLAGGRAAVAAKVLKPNQDFRLDPPVIAPDTITTMIQAGLKALVVDASQTLILDKQKVIRLVDEANLVLLAWTDDTPQR